MKLLLNNYTVDFKLDEEKTVAEVARAVSSWARDRELVFYEFYTDGEHHYVETAPDTPVEAVSVMNCVVLSRADIVISSIEEGARYCDRIAAFIDERGAGGKLNDEDAGQLAAGAEWLGEMVQKAISLLAADPAQVKSGDRTAAECVDMLGEIAQNPSGSDPARVRELVAGLKDMLRSLLLGKEMKALIAQSIDSPDMLVADLEKCAEELEDQKKGIEEAAAAFQTGKDVVGSEKLSIFTDFVYRLTRIFYQSAPVFGLNLTEIAVDGEPLEERIGRIKDLLIAVTEAMENGDIVGLCDVLEYEMKPALDGMDGYVEQIRERIS